MNRKRMWIGASALTIASALAYAAMPTILATGTGDQIGLWGGPASLTARNLVTPVGETTGAWHYHPGYVYSVVRQGTITVEDGCGEVKSYRAGQAFETTGGRVHRAYNLGSEDAVEYNMFVAPPGRPLTVPIPNNEQRCGPPGTVEECSRSSWQKFNHPHAFRDQAACVAYVKGRRRITLLVPEDPLR